MNPRPATLITALACGWALVAAQPADAAPRVITIKGTVTNGRPLTGPGGSRIVIPDGLPHVQGALVTVAGTGIATRTRRGGSFTLRFTAARVRRTFSLRVRSGRLGGWTMTAIPRYSPQGALNFYIQLASKPQRLRFASHQRFAPTGHGPRARRLAAHPASGCTGFYSNTTPPSTIRVYMVEDGDVQTYNFLFYVQHVLPHEWPAAYDWNETAYEVGAMAVKNYGWFMANGARPGEYDGQCYDVDDTTDYQKFEPTQPTATSTNDAINDTWDYRIVKGGTIFEAPFDCSMRFYYSGQNSDCYSEPCGYEANGQEMSQYGSQSCAEDGDSWQQILHIYYSGITIAPTALPGDGSFVSYGGRTYRIVGGYPMLVTSCSTLPSACGSPTAISSLSLYSSSIANGAAMVETDYKTGAVYSALGGTIVHVTSCSGKDASVCAGEIQVNYASIVAYIQQHPTIANGTAIVQYDHDGGAVYSAVGGTIVHVTSCSGKDNPVCTGAVQEPYATIAAYLHQHPRIANGTAIVQYDHAGGAVYSALGGTIVHVTSCSGKDVPVCAGEVQEPYATIVDYVHQHPRIANGTAIVQYDHAGGAYYSTAGGTIVHVTSCSGKDNPVCVNAVQEPWATIAAYNHQHPRIATGTILYYQDHGTGYLLVHPKTLQHIPCNTTSCTRKATQLPYTSITQYAHQHHLQIT